VVGTTQRDIEQERNIIDELLRRRVDGLVVMPTATDHDQAIAGAGNRRPLVLLDRWSTAIKADAVLLDNRAARGEATLGLIATGTDKSPYRWGFQGQHRVPSESPATGGRSRLWAGLSGRLVRSEVHDAASAAQSCRAARWRRPADRGLRRQQPPDCRRIGRCRPARDAPRRGRLRRHPSSLRWLRVPLTVVSYDAVEMGKAAARRLFARINGDTSAPRRITIPVRIVRHIHPEG